MEAKKADFTKEDVCTWWHNKVFYVAAKIKLMDKYNIDKGLAGKTIFYEDLLRIYKGEHGIVDEAIEVSSTIDEQIKVLAEDYSSLRANKETEKDKWLEIRCHYYSGMKDFKDNQLSDLKNNHYKLLQLFSIINIEAVFGKSNAEMVNNLVNNGNIINEKYK